MTGLGVLRGRLRPLFAAVVFLIGCSTVPVTGRRQLDLVSDSSLLSMSADQYQQFLTEHPLSTDRAKTDLVKRTGTRIAAAVEQFLRDKGMADEISNYGWQFNLVESDEANAWAMPGGKVVVYTGILPVTQDETGLAVVMSHEIAHVVAHHGSERMSQGLLAQFGGMALSEALKSKPQETQQLLLSAYGVGVQVGALLPYSRLQESEADHLGLIFMAMAGYNPDEALTFWQRMARQGGAKPPEFLSTHPSDATRIEDIRKELPEARQYARK